jgi:hypothetical protein
MFTAGAHPGAMCFEPTWLISPSAWGARPLVCLSVRMARDHTVDHPFSGGAHPSQAADAVEDAAAGMPGGPRVRLPPCPWAPVTPALGVSGEAPAQVTSHVPVRQPGPEGVPALRGRSRFQGQGPLQPRGATGGAGNGAGPGGTLRRRRTARLGPLPAPAGRAGRGPAAFAARLGGEAGCFPAGRSPSVRRRMCRYSAPGRSTFHTARLRDRTHRYAGQSGRLGLPPAPAPCRREYRTPRTLVPPRCPTIAAVGPDRNRGAGAGQRRPRGYSRA